MITKTFSSLWNKMKSWVSRRDDNFLRIVEEVEFRITENDDFLLRVAEEIASQGGIAVDDVAQHMDHNEVAQEMDAYEIADLIAGDIHPNDIAEQLEIDAQAIADEFDITEIASCIDIDYDEVRAGLDLDAFQPAEVDEDSIMNAVIEEVVSRLEAN
jgi:hypothetical protein